MKASLEKTLKKLDKLQYLLYADHKRALLLVFQGLDAAGKDGAIRHVMSGINPQGCRVTSFKLHPRKRPRTIFSGASTTRAASPATSASSTALTMRMC